VWQGRQRITVWQGRQRITPIVLLVGDMLPGRCWGSHNHTAVMLQHLALWGLNESLVVLEHDLRLPRNNVALAQVARAYVAGLCGGNGPLADAVASDAYVVATDVGIIPLAGRSYWLPDEPGALGRATNAPCCSHTTWLDVSAAEPPMSSVACRASNWRRLMGTVTAASVTPQATPTARTPTCQRTSTPT
jgi:hypothetical protein